MSAASATTKEPYETIEFIKKGQVTIPKRIRETYHIEPGQKGTLIELEGALLILPRPSQIPTLFDEIRDGLGTTDMSLEEMVLEMRRIRETSDYEAKA
jgi:AbrB family looped-hinge helix DNA binding protein